MFDSLKIKVVLSNIETLKGFAITQSLFNNIKSEWHKGLQSCYGPYTINLFVNDLLMCLYICNYWLIVLVQLNSNGVNPVFSMSKGVESNLVPS